MTIGARALLYWLLLCSAMTRAEHLLTVAPNVERQQRTVFEAGYSAMHHLIAGQAGLDTRLQFMPIAQAQRMLADGHARIQLGGVCGVKRSTPVLYSLPYAQFERHLIAIDDTPVITRLADLRGKRLGLVKGYFYQLPEASELQQQGIDLSYSAGVRESLEALLVGDVDVILANAYVINNIAKSMHQAARLNYQVDQPFSERQICYVVANQPGAQDLVDKLNHAVVELYQRGTLQRYIIPPYQVSKSKSLMLKVKAE